MMQNRVSRLFSSIAVFLFLSCANDKRAAPFYEAIAISDGDTFTLLTEKKEQKKVRLYGIDSPEKGQPFGANAKQKLSDLIFRKKVSIDILDTDRYGRVVAIVYNQQNECINELMLQNGLAWHYKDYDDDIEWARMELQAKRNKIGLWSEPAAIAPWEWRKGQRPKSAVLP